MGATSINIYKPSIHMGGLWRFTKINWVIDVVYQLIYVIGSAFLVAFSPSRQVYAKVARNTTKYVTGIWISWNIMEYHGISWNIYSLLPSITAPRRFFFSSSGGEVCGKFQGLRLRWRGWNWTAAVHAHGLGSQCQGERCDSAGFWWEFSIAISSIDLGIDWQYGIFN